ncbi:hypothetical protein GCM10009860_13720 [Microbacterium mitrae]|nr:MULTISPECIES: PaaX family transcriptional regulator [Micrococcales]GMA19085.1 hypothetical protein GCM10025862_11060 [Arsenicicoccus piscis]
MSSRIAGRTIVEAFLPMSGKAPLAPVYDTAHLLGTGDQPVRLAIRRMQAAGELTQSGRGRSGTLQLTDTGRGRIDRDRSALALAFTQDAGRLQWDSSWSLYTVGAPERERAARDSLRRTLLASGAAALATGTFLSPHDLRPLLDPAMGRYVISATARDLNIRGVTDPLAIAEELWPAGPIDAAYDVMDAAIKQDDPTAHSDVRRILLADALEAALRNDPLIPLDLRHSPWRPTTLRRKWLALWNDIAPSAAYSSWGTVTVPAV